LSNEVQAIWKDVDGYFSGALIQPDAADLPAIDVTPLQGRFMELLVRMTGARRVLEIGTLGGYSTIWLARSLPKNGVVITLEVEPKHAEIARKNIEVAGLADRVDLRLGPALETLAVIGQEHGEPFDFIFIDADKAGYPEYLQWSLTLSRSGTLIVADNVVRDGKVIEPENPDANIQGVRRFTDLVAAEPRLTATVLQTVGSKGYDGFTIALVN
jgi:predicted O-methyltransferase YrrM